MLTRIIVHVAAMGSHHAATMGHATTGTISSRQNIPPHRMVMVATDPLTTSGRNNTGIILGATSALPVRTIALVLVRLTQTTQVGESTVISALVNDATTESDRLVPADGQDTATTATTASLGIAVTSSEAATRTETIAGAVPSAMSAVDETSVAAHLNRTEETGEDTRASAQAPIPAILAVKTAPGNSSSQMIAQEDPIVRHIMDATATTNVSRATTNASIDVTKRQIDAMTFADQNDRRALVKDSAMTTGSTQKSDTSRAYQMAAYSRDHDLYSAKKHSSGPASLRVPTI